MEYENLPDAVKAPKSLSATMIPAKPGRKLYRLVGEQTEPSTQLNIMDYQLTNIYGNVEIPSRKSSINSSEAIYQNVLSHSEEKRTGPEFSDGDADVEAVENGRKSTCRAAATCLGLLCILLLVGLITVVFLFIKLEMDKQLLQTTFNNQTKDMDQIQTSYNTLSGEKKQLQASYDNLNKQRDQLQTTLNRLSRDKDQLQTSKSAVIKGRRELLFNFIKLQTIKCRRIAQKTEVKWLQQQLITLNITMRLLLYQDSLNMEASLKNLSEECNELRKKLTVSERGSQNIEANFKTLTEERDELKMRLIDFDKNTLAIKTLTQERDELKTNVTNFITAYCFQQEWVYFSGSVYYISSITKTWKESKSDCEQRGAHLMIINSRIEQSFTRLQKDNMWIGLTDTEREGTWKWVDGTPLTTRFWASNEPNSYGKKEEDCAEVRYHGNENNWNDAPSRSRGLKTCTGKDGKGMKGQIFHRWVAVSFCLLCILQAALNITLRLALSVGSNCKNLSDVKEEWKRINTTLQLNSFTKELDNLQKQLNFNASQKTVLAKERDELKRKLDDFTSQKTVLAKERDELKRKLDDFIHYSQKGWVYFSGSFYYVSSTQKTWTESRDDCLEQNADLMIINSKEEQVGV
ncbi:hypothetical protein Q8A73_003524 [Channa argus]|nr:hypothetical protein Q8A73_003524 [Channa argus]